jgi:hypothetical protein
MPTDLVSTPAAAAGRTVARRRGRSRAALLGAAVGVAGLLVVQWTVLDQPGYLVSRTALLYLTLLWWALGLATAALLVAAAPRRLAIALLATAAVAIPALAVTHGPRMSDDLYRYAWDGRVQAAGIDPYRYGPLAPELSPLRDAWLFPDSAGCTEADPRPRCTRLNYPREHTIYPPVAEAYFTAVHVLPGPPREHKLQLYASLLSLGLTGLLMAALAARGCDPRHAAFYALTPLAGIDAGSDAHVDVLGALLAVGAIMILTTRGRAARPLTHPGLTRRSRPATGLPGRFRGPAEDGNPTRLMAWRAGALLGPADDVSPNRRLAWLTGWRHGPADDPGPGPSRQRAWLAGALLGAAVAVKLYPVLLLPAAIRRRPASVLASAGAVVGLSYLPHVLAVGTKVVGFLPRYLRVEGYEQGSRFLLLAGLGLQGTAAKAVAGCVLGGVLLAVLRSDPRRVPVERAALWLVGTAFLVATPAQPWYGVLLAVLAILAGRPEWLAVPAAGYALYISLFTPVPGDAWTLRVTAYALAALIVATATAIRLARRPRDTRNRAVMPRWARDTDHRAHGAP